MRCASGYRERRRADRPSLAAQAASMDVAVVAVGGGGFGRRIPARGIVEAFGATLFSQRTLRHWRALIF
jgi:hypothetical protein